MNGIDLTLSKRNGDTKGLWTSPIGVKFSINWGKLTKKVVKFWRYRWGENWSTAPNPWKNPDDCWFTVKLPWFIGPFLSISIFNFGFYIGFKLDRDDGLIPTARITFNRRGE
jgi:hypothetical protein